MAIGWFIDGAFLYKCYPRQLDYTKLRYCIEAELNDHIDEGYYFNSDDDPPRSTKFNHYLSQHPPLGPGLRTKIYWLSKRRLYWPYKLGGQPVLHPDDPNVHYELTQQKAVDVGLAFHMVRSYYQRKWGKLVLCAGDGDFHEPVQSLVEGENVDLYLVGTQSSISAELRGYARRIIEVDQEPWRSQVER
ncbi:NYN domain-containing protein [Pseudomonas sp. NPDC007930]|uniref:NYN domain-containing protein n=1 Tax=Pseudomonas sp. NPDC007930 TaxID=3364417 RepID=UPI0036E48F2C